MGIEARRIFARGTCTSELSGASSLLYTLLGVETQRSRQHQAFAPRANIHGGSLRQRAGENVVLTKASVSVAIAALTAPRQPL